MATLSDLRRYVQEELSDYQTYFEPESINRTLNRGQDLFTRDTGYLRAVNVQSIVATTPRYTIVPSANYRIGRILIVQLFDGTSDDWPVEPMSVVEMASYNSDWRNTTGSRPTHYIRNFDPDTADTARNESLYLYPEPDTAYMNGLRVTYTLVTDGQMTADTTDMALPERIGLEAIVSYACAELLGRKAVIDPEAAHLLLAQSERYRLRWTEDLRLAVSEASNAYANKNRLVRGYWV